MDRRIKKADKKHRVNSLLFLIGLRDTANTRISHLSGGERKRLSLAEEVILSIPRCMYLVSVNIVFDSFWTTLHSYSVMNLQLASTATVLTVL